MDLCTISFQAEAFDTAAHILRQMLSYSVEVFPREGEKFSAALVDVTVGEDGQYKAVLAPYDEEHGEPDHTRRVALDIYDEIERLEMV